MNEKSWYTSKTLWFNVLTLVLAILGTLSTSPLLANKVEVLGLLSTVSTTGNLVLRLFFTDSKLTL